MSFKQIKAKSDKNDNKAKSMSLLSSFSINKEIMYITRKQNIDFLKNNLKARKNYNPEIISQLKTNVENPQPILESFKKVDNYKDFKLDDDLFEKNDTTFRINFSITSYDYFPLYEVNTSKQNGKEVTLFNFYKISIYKEKEIQKVNEYFFLADRNCINISYNDYTIILDIQKGNNLGCTIISQYFNKKIDKQFVIKDGNIYNTSFYQGEIEISGFSLDNNTNQI